MAILNNRSLLLSCTVHALVLGGAWGAVVASRSGHRTPQPLSLRQAAALEVPAPLTSAPQNPDARAEPPPPLPEPPLDDPLLPEALPSVEPAPLVFADRLPAFLLPRPPAPEPTSEATPTPPPPETPPAEAEITATLQEVIDGRQLALHAPPPQYPRRAWDRGLTGSSVWIAEVAADGTVTRCTLDRSSGHSTLDRAAEAALKTWRFRPRLVDGRPQPFRVRVPFEFRK